MTIKSSWEKFTANLYYNADLGLQVDISAMGFPPGYLEEMEEKIQDALDKMADLEKGATANPDEGRMVGHYWLRNPGLAPESGITEEITKTIKIIKDFAARVHQGQILSPTGKVFKNVILVGIGGSALGPQLVKDALSTGSDPLDLFFVDNTDPEGIQRILGQLEESLEETMVLVISKSGGTVETRNGMLEAARFYEERGLNFPGHAVAVTQLDSGLDKMAVRDKWLRRFPMWDWVGGRTSVTSAVGLLPAALEGFDVDSLLRGASMTDEATRSREVRNNPAALISLMWYYAAREIPGAAMVILPYKDRLQLFAKYLQQLIMESLGKEKDLEGSTVHQGIAVFGNKGSTDQHSYVQQLVDGPQNIFITFIEVLKDGPEKALQVEEKVTSGDYLSAFLLGTRKALAQKGRGTITLTVNEVSAFTLGSLIALYERAVGLYASLVNINAYHQPAVEHGKKAAQEAVALQRRILQHLGDNSGQRFTVEDLARALQQQDQKVTIFKILRHLSANPTHGVKAEEADPIYMSKFHI